MSREPLRADGVLPHGMLRRNYGKGGRGGSYYMRLRIVPNKTQVAQAVDLGLGTRNLAEAQQRALNILNALDVLGWRYCCRIEGEQRRRIEYDDIRSWRRQLRKLSTEPTNITPTEEACQPELPGLESFCDHE